MTKEGLLELKEYLSHLSDEERKKMDLHLRRLATGEEQGPSTGYPSIDKPWLKYYPEDAIVSDVPKMKAYDYVYERNKNFPNQVALSYLGRTIKYEEFFRKIDQVAASFKSIGVKRGDIVTMAMATSPEMVYILYALNKIGAVVNIIDPRLTGKEIAEKINISSSKVFIGLEMAVSNICSEKEETSLENVIVVSPFESANFLIKILGKSKEKKFNDDIKTWDDFISCGKRYNGKIEEDFEDNKPAIIIYTGGTTGAPKGVVLTNENLNAMAVMQVVSGYNLQRKDTFLNFLPPFSAYSVVQASHIPLSLGLSITQVPLFKPEDFPKLMRKYRPNHVMSGPILWDIMMNDKLSRRANLSDLKSPISGGDSLQIEMEKDINDFLKRNGCQFRIQQGYGMTEVSAAAFYSTENSYKLGSVGIPLVKNNVSIRNIETGEELMENQDGEILISTPTMMQEYFQNEKATSEIIENGEDGVKWIHTGDIGHIDESGHLFIVGRIKRMIVRSGNKIFPSNVENIIMTLPEIGHCSIVGMPDSKEKSSPIAHIVLSEEYIGCEESIIQKIEDTILSNLPDYNIPKKYVFRNSLPVTEMSKVDFKQLELESIDFSKNDDRIIIIRDNRVKVLKK